MQAKTGLLPLAVGAAAVLAVFAWHSVAYGYDFPANATSVTSFRNTTGSGIVLLSPSSSASSFTILSYFARVGTTGYYLLYCGPNPIGTFSWSTTTTGYQLFTQTPCTGYTVKYNLYGTAPTSSSFTMVYTVGTPEPPKTASASMSVNMTSTDNHLAVIAFAIICLCFLGSAVFSYFILRK